MTKFEIVVPCDIYEQNSDFFYTVMTKHCTKWALNKHHKYTNANGVETATFDHYHLGGWLSSNNDPDYIAKWFANDFGFEIKANNIQKIKSQWVAYCLYIGLHYSDPDKEPFTLANTSFWASDNTDLSALVTVAENHTNDDDILDSISKGEIKEYQIVERYGVQWYRKHYRDIETALKVYTKTNSRGGQGMKTIIWVYGETGTGKTALATMSLSKGNAYYLACDRNPLDDYKGEPVLILDDISDGTMTSKALLKLLDPNYTAPAGARYYNKMVTAETIIVTSTISPKQWWINNRQNEKNNGDFEQLLRRLTGGVFHIIDESTIDLMVYDPHGRDMLSMRVDMPKDVKDVLVGTARVTLQDRANNIAKMFNLTFTEVKTDTVKQGSFVDEYGFQTAPNDYKFGDDMD